MIMRLFNISTCKLSSNKNSDEWNVSILSKMLIVDAFEEALRKFSKFVSRSTSSHVQTKTQVTFKGAVESNKGVEWSLQTQFA